MRRIGRQPVSRRRDDKLARVDPAAFEELVAGHYRRLGYTVERIGHGGSHFDGGIDLKLRRGDEYIVVQCKRENAYQVTHNVGHELIGVMCTQRATGAIVVNTGEYTRHALESASAEGRLTLVDGDEVRRWFPEMAGPSTEPVWEPVAVGYARHRRTRPDQSTNEGAKALGWLAVLVALMVWQCSRSDAPGRISATRVPAVRAPVVSSTVASPPAASQENPSMGSISSPVTPAASAVEPAIRHLSQEELEEWKRGNEDSMKILEKTTPELPLAPQGP